MSKNSFRYILFIGLLFLFGIVFSNKIDAINQDISVTNIEGLVYGNTLGNATIYGNSNGVEGVFTFADKDRILSTVGEIELEVLFIPKDSNSIVKINYLGIVEKRKISVVFDSPIYKQYDGNTSIDLPRHSYKGILHNEVTVEGVLLATLSASYVSEGIPVILSGIEIVGEKKDYYYLDLLGHYARISPSKLEKEGSLATTIYLDKNVYVDVGYILRVNSKEESKRINDTYTSFKTYTYNVYSHNNTLLTVAGTLDIYTKVEKGLLDKERLALFELTKDGEYKQLDYSINGEYLNVKIAGGSAIVFATRNIEYHFIVLFSFLLLCYGIFIVVYRLSKTKMSIVND